MFDIAVAIIVGLVMFIGLIGAIVPGIPDVVLIWGAALGYGLYVGWGERGIWLFGLISLLGLAGLFTELWVSGTAARMGGASIRAIFAGLALGLVALLLSGPVGGVIWRRRTRTSTGPPWNNRRMFPSPSPHRAARPRELL